MSDQFWLTKAQLKRIEPFFPRTRGIPRVDDRRVVSGIIHVIVARQRGKAGRRRTPVTVRHRVKPHGLAGGQRNRPRSRRGFGVNQGAPALLNRCT
jgi:transposase